MAQDHHINKYRIVIQAQDENRDNIGSEIQTIKAETFNILQQLFDKYIPTDRVVELNKIDLDLGSLPQTNFKEEYHKRLVELLETELKQLAENPAFKKHIKQSPKFISDRFQLLSHYLLKGYIPPQEHPFDPDQLIEELVEVDKERLSKTLQNVWESKIGRKRMQKQLKASTYGDLKKLLIKGKGQKRSVGTDKHLELFRQYFIKGTLPDWYESTDILKLDQALSRLPESWKRDFVTNLLQWIKKPGIKERVARAFTLSTLKKAFATTPQFKKPIAQLEAIERTLKKTAISGFTGSTAYKRKWLTWLEQREKITERADVLKALLEDHTTATVQPKIRKALEKELKKLAEPELIEAFQKTEKSEDTVAENNAMAIFMQFMEKGVLPKGVDFEELLTTLLASHTVLLSKMLHAKWHLYPVRYRLTYQTKLGHLIQVFPLMFGSSNYLPWFESFFDQLPDQMAITTLPEKSKRDLYFTFFNVMATAVEEPLNKEQFYQAFLLELTTVVPVLRSKLLTLQITDSSDFSAISEEIVKLLKAVDQLEDQEDDLEKQWLELLTEGEQSEVYKQQLKKSENWESFLKRSIERQILTPPFILSVVIHKSFWSEILPKTQAESIKRLFKQLAVFQLDHVEKSINELPTLESELTIPSGVIYPVSIQIYVELIKTLHESRFAVSSSQLIDILLKATFSRLEKQIGKSVFKKLVTHLANQVENPVFTYQFKVLTNWLKSEGRSIIRKYSEEKDGEEGIKNAFSDKYTSQDLIVFYLKEGKMPQWSAFKSKKEVVKFVHEKVQNYEFEWFGKFDTTTAIVKQRLVDSLEASSFSRLLDFINPSKSQILLESLIDLKEWSEHTATVKTSSQKAESFLKLSIFNLLLESITTTTESDIRSLLRLITNQYDIPYLSLITSLQETPGNLKNKHLRNVIEKEFNLLTREQAITWRKSGVKTSEHSAEDIISHYLETGRVPRWSGFKSKTEIKTLIQSGIKLVPEIVLDLMMRLQAVKGSTTRFLAMVKVSEIRQLTQLLEPGKFLLIEDAISDFVVLHQKSNLFSDTEATFKRTIYTALLNIQAEKLGKYYEARELLQALLKAVSDTYNLKHETLIEHAGKYYPKYKSEFFKSLVREMVKPKERDSWLKEGIKKQYQEIFTTHDLVLYYLKTETLPEWSSFSGKKQIQEVLRQSVEKSIVDISDALIEIRQDRKAKAVLIDMLRDQDLYEILKRSDNYHFKLYLPIVESLLKAEAFVKAASVKRRELKKHLQVLLFSEIIKGDPYQSAETFAAHLITETASQFVVDVQMLYQALEEQWDKLKSKPLQKAVQDQREIVVEKAENEEVAVEANINALLYMMAHQRIPWWHIKRTKRRASLKTEKQRLYKLLLKDHLSQLLKVIQGSGQEAYFLGELFEDTSIHEFNRIVSDLAPGISGFVVMYTRALETLSKTDYQNLAFPISKKVYSHIYQYVRANKSGFTASGFVVDITSYTAFYLKEDEEILAEKIIAATKQLTEKGEPKFKTLLEVLQHVEPTPEVEKEEEEMTLVYEEKIDESAEDNIINILPYYFQHGTLPFRSTIGSFNDILKAIDKEAHDNAGEFRTVLITAVQKSVAIERLLHHGPELFFKITAFLFEVAEKEVEIWFKGIVDFVKAELSVTRSKAEALATKVLMQAVGTSQPRLDYKVLNKLFFTEAGSTISNLETRLFKALQHYKPSAQISKSFVSALQKSIEQVPVVKPKKKIIKEEDSDPLEGMVEIHNAGAVILANFLPRYFDMLGMTEKRAFKDEKTAARAVLLLQYLVSGEIETPEHELVLNKILCGVDLEYPVDLSIELTDKEKEISERLLMGVLQNWDKLKSNSIEALREVFLMRIGYIKETSYNWELKVEESGKDILIDFLPWSIGTIKLSWMKKSLNVEWRK